MKNSINGYFQATKVVYNLLISKFSNLLIPFFVILPPIAYGLRPITSSSFFRLETPFLTFSFYAMCFLCTFALSKLINHSK